MSQPLKVAGFQVIISGRFWVITKALNNHLWLYLPTRAADALQNAPAAHFFLKDAI